MIYLHNILSWSHCSPCSVPLNVVVFFFSSSTLAAGEIPALLGEKVSILSLQIMRLLARNSGLSHGSELFYVTTETLFPKVFHEAWDVLSILPVSQC